uniref:Corticotropin-releasing factor domain-containing protein n=1 Tax=Anopheles atroparvus TaxID=41427 RepID=A0A182IYV1_ANOAO
MRGTLWLWLAGTALVCVSLQVAALPYSDTRVIQDNSLLSLKRTKPSLSIVNPLDVLRQRIILEMARKQMRENNRQVELNKALLREIGKRSSSNFYGGMEDPLDYAYYDRKPYSQRVAPDPERSTAEDELEAMVESLLRGSHLNLAEANRQRIRSINDRQASLASHQDGTQDKAHSQLQPQQQLGRLFSNEQQPVQANQNEGYQQHDDDNNDNGRVDDEVMGGSAGALKGLPDQDSYMDASQVGPGKSESTGNAKESDFRPRYVYGMYKNRYTN